MNNMFKKSLVAVAVLGFSSSALAADLDITPVWVSSEYIATIGDEGEETKNITVNINTNYADNDIIRVHFEGVMPSAVRTTGTIGGTGTVNVIAYDASTGEAVLRTTGITADTDADTFVIEADYDVADVSANATVTYQAYLGNSDTKIGSEAEATVYGLASQFASLAVDPSADAVIDVSANRYSFEDASTTGAAEISDDLPENDPPFAFGKAVAATAYEYTVTGNFGWLLDGEGDYDDAVAAIEVCGEPTNTFEVTATTVVFECAPTDTTLGGFLLTPGTAEVAIPTQSLTVAAEVSFENADNTNEAGSASFSAVDFGEWTLNGSDVFVSYVPFRGGISQVINITNRSTQDGSVSVVAIDEDGNEFELNDIATSEAGTITAIAGAINTALSNATSLNLHPVNGQAATKRYALRIITNAPEADIEVYSAYNVSGTGARLVVNSSNGK